MRLRWEQDRLALDTGEGLLESPTDIIAWCAERANLDQVDWFYIGGVLVLLVASQALQTPQRMDEIVKLVDSYYVVVPPAAAREFDAGVNEAAYLVTRAREADLLVRVVDTWNQRPPGL